MSWWASWLHGFSSAQLIPSLAELPALEHWSLIVYQLLCPYDEMPRLPLWAIMFWHEDPSRPLGAWLRRTPRPCARFLKRKEAGNQRAMWGVASALQLGEVDFSDKPPLCPLSDTSLCEMKSIEFLQVLVSPSVPGDAIFWLCQPQYFVQSPNERVGTC